MKKIVAMILSILLCISCAPKVMATESEKLSDINVASTASESISTLAAQHLKNMKVQLDTSCETLGFSYTTFMNMSTGTPFTVYTFDTDGNVVSDDVYLCPLIYSNQIVGTIGIYYDTLSSSYCYSISTSHAAQFNELMYTTRLNRSSGVVIGHIGDKLFATDGTNVLVLFDEPGDDSNSVNISHIKEICGIVKSNAISNYLPITSIAGNEEANIQREEINPVRSLPNPLPVPHVEQVDGGVCGIAAWAAVLNYRFGTSYTNSSLDTAMNSGGYNNGDSGIPIMTDYRDFANDEYNAGCVFSSSPLSFSGVSTAINAGKPIMGAWYSGSGSRKIYHAIIITGYQRISSSNYTYHLKNPWYENTVAITVTSSSSVVYPDYNYTWQLSQVVY